MATQEDKRRYDAARRMIAGRRRGQRLTRQAAREMLDAAEVVAAYEDRRPLPPVRRQAARPGTTTPRALPPKERLAKLRRDFGSERSAAVWDALPEPLQRHWLYTLKEAGEPLTAGQQRELRAFESKEVRVYGLAR